MAVLTVAVTALAVMLRAFYYIYYFGYHSFYGIDFSYIDASGENIMYQLVFYIGMSCLWFLLNFFVFYLIQIQRKILRLWLIPFYAALAGLGTFILELSSGDVKGKSDPRVMGLLFLFSLLFFIAITIFGILAAAIKRIIKKRAIHKNAQEDDSKITSPHDIGRSLKQMAAIVIAGVLFYALMFFILGYWGASINTNFKVVESSEVVLCETNGNFLLAKCKISPDKKTITVYKNKQRLVPNTQVAYTKCHFEKSVEEPDA